jgi:hypothetical protein
VAGAVRAEARVIMATREASLGASACHLKRHHERRLGVTVVHTAGTQRSVQLPSGAIRLRTSSTRSPVRTSGGRSGRGRPRGGTSANSAGGPRCRGHGCRVCCTTVLTVRHSTRNTTANIERACDATHHRNSETDPRAVIAPRCAPRTSGKQVTGTTKNHASRTPWPCPLPDARARPTRFARRAAAPYPHIQPCSEVSAPPPGP